MTMSSDNEQVLLAASKWYALLASGEATPDEIAQWEAWRIADVRHSEAWSRIEALSERWGAMPSNVKSDILLSLPASPGRRRAVKHLLVLCGVGASTVWAYKRQPWREIWADYATATGEIRRVTLPDGSVLYINTASAVNVKFSEQQRVIELVKGEVLIHTAKEQGPYRPLLVATRHGSATALGTKFSVRDHEDHTKVMVTEGAVFVAPIDSHESPVMLQAGQSVMFTQVGTSAVLQEEGGDAWANGMLVAFSMPMSDFVAELSRYRRGVLRCDPSLAHLKVSGSFLVNDTDAVLKHLTNILPVRIERFTAYWVTILPV